MTFLIYPKSKKRVSFIDYLLSFSSLIPGIYTLSNFEKIVSSAGLTPTIFSSIVSLMVIVLIVLASLRVVGKPLTTVVIFSLIYCLFGKDLPVSLGHRGYNIVQIADFQFMSLNGILGIALGVVSTFVAIFIIFGAFLEKSGVGEFIINLGFILTGRFVGGAAKAAVVSSGLMGSVSGSAVANTIATGTFTIPLMKKTGYKDYEAAAIEAASSVGGQMMPPIMGAGAFVMSGITGIPYSTIVIVSIVPAILYFFSVLLMTHFSAVRNDIRGLTKEELPDIKNNLKYWFLLLPVVVLVVLLLLHYSPMLAAFWSIISLLIVTNIKKHTRISFNNFLGALELGGRNIIMVSIACAAAGIIVGSVLQTGLALKFVSLITTLGEGNLFLAIILTFVAAYILGMGLPVVAAYVVLAVLGGGALTHLGLPVLTAHLIIFWFSQTANITPPVCLGAYAAAGISGSDPMKTGFTAMKLSLGLLVIPILFAYTPILFTGSHFEVIKTIIISIIAIIPFCATVQGFFLRETKWYERFLLLISTISLFCTNVWINAGGLILLFFVGFLQKSEAKWLINK